MARTPSLKLKIAAASLLKRTSSVLRMGHAGHANTELTADGHEPTRIIFWITDCPARPQEPHGAGAMLQITVAGSVSPLLMTPLIHMSLAMKSLGA
jgi:hypothetical protein